MNSGVGRSVLRNSLHESARGSRTGRTGVEPAEWDDGRQPRSFDLLHELLEKQAYRLAFWRVSGEEINYRRFFDINDLVGLRMENPRVFAETHHLMRKLLAEGLISGLRIDHPDGLLDPMQYFMRLQRLYAASQCVGAEPVAAARRRRHRTRCTRRLWPARCSRAESAAVPAGREDPGAGRAPAGTVAGRWHGGL